MLIQISISFQFLSALQKLEQFRETMPQLPRLVETFAHRSVRRHATDTVQRLQIRQNRLVRMHGIVELQKTLHAEHRQA